ncbi:MAG: hypothetical protein NT166_00655 [Candidatus Aminicenantes bacterium]|nr:hypothetical protein [Candidatus Aminicenantes bacterium]
MKEKKNVVELKKDQMKQTKAGMKPLLCSVCDMAFFDGTAWVRTCGWTGLPGQGCPF